MANIAHTYEILSDCPTEITPMLSLLLALRGRHIHLQEFIVARRLDLDQIRRVIGILELPEYFAFGFGHGLTFPSCFLKIVDFTRK